MGTSSDAKNNGTTPSLGWECVEWGPLLHASVTLLSLVFWQYEGGSMLRLKQVAVPTETEKHRWCNSEDFCGGATVNRDGAAVIGSDVGGPEDQY